jgi:glucose-1-phosphate adenylyltransferase
MGNYIFSTEVLIDTLKAIRPCSEQDFGRDVLPRLIHTHKVCVYDFALNQVPGIKPYEEQPYWRDVGTIDAYFAAHMDMLGEEPRFEIFNPSWPIYSDNYLGPDTRIIDGEVRNSILGAGTIIRGARINRSVIRREVIVEPDADIDECIIMDYTVIGRGSKLRRTIVDRYNIIPPGSVIGDGRYLDKNQSPASPPRITIVPKGKRGPASVY